MKQWYPHDKTETSILCWSNFKTQKNSGEKAGVLVKVVESLVPGWYPDEKLVNGW